MQATHTLADLLAYRVKRAREARSWHRAELALRANVSKTYITRIEAGEYPRPSFDRIARIAGALEMRVADLTDPEGVLGTPPIGLRQQLIQLLGVEDGPAVAALLLAWPELTPAERDANVRVIRALTPPRPA